MSDDLKNQRRLEPGEIFILAAYLDDRVTKERSPILRKFLRSVSEICLTSFDETPGRIEHGREQSEAFLQDMYRDTPKMTPFVLTSRDAVEQLISGKQSADTGVLCPQCFEPVRKTPIERGVICRCSCYMRGFEDAEKGDRLSIDTWATYIKESTGRKICEAANNDAIINIALAPNYDCWCPGCRRERKLGAKVIWVSLAEEYVCTWGACKACAEAMRGASKSARYEFNSLCQDRLLERYPFLNTMLGT
jgi:hypothetical protein